MLEDHLLMLGSLCFGLRTYGSAKGLKHDF